MKRCCMKCRANLSTLLCSDILSDALWRATHLTHATFMAELIAFGAYISELFNLPNFKYDYIVDDLMHVVGLLDTCSIGKE